MASLAVQLDFLQDQTEESFRNLKVDTLIKSQDTLRRGFFVRHKEHERIISRHEEEIEALKKQFAILMRNK